jgi:hypothetical protein
MTEENYKRKYPTRSYPRWEWSLDIRFSDVVPYFMGDDAKDTLYVQIYVRWVSILPKSTFSSLTDIPVCSCNGLDELERDQSQDISLFRCAHTREPTHHSHSPLLLPLQDLAIEKNHNKLCCHQGLSPPPSSPLLSLSIACLTVSFVIGSESSHSDTRRLPLPPKTHHSH